VNLVSDDENGVDEMYGERLLATYKRIPKERANQVSSTIHFTSDDDMDNGLYEERFPAIYKAVPNQKKPIQSISRVHLNDSDADENDDLYGEPFDGTRALRTQGARKRLQPASPIHVTDDEDDLYGERYTTSHTRAPPTEGNDNIDDSPDSARIDFELGTGATGISTIDGPSTSRQNQTVNPSQPFFSPPKGQLQHPHIGWIIDEVTMNSFMRDWAKQEGFAVNKNTNNMVVYWRCVHYGKYRNRYNLPSEVTEKSNRQDLLEKGISFAKVAISEA